ncbi:MAG TPA: hemerythrin domain-containing protein [Rhodanobacteraceae bacterium]|jgi:hemerythrin superfamily protein|nr:hemerythrin domain-containing protein [Rhodanobacteraceae bacterium]
MHAIVLLAAEHELMALLIRDLQRDRTADEMTKRYALRRLAALIGSHSTIEEEILYAAFRKTATTPEDQILYYEALAEHRSLTELMLPDLMRTPLASPAFPGRLKALQEQLEHHFAEEEEEIFPRIKELVGDRQLEEMGVSMARRRAEIGLIG